MPVTEPFFINNLPKNTNLLEGAGNENVTVAQKIGRISSHLSIQKVPQYA